MFRYLISNLWSSATLSGVLWMLFMTLVFTTHGTLNTILAFTGVTLFITGNTFAVAWTRASRQMQQDNKNDEVKS